MSFLAPALLLGALGIALPVLAHLLNRHQPQTTDWAAMQFLNRSVRVRSRQLRLRDLLLLVLRCLVLLFLVMAIAKPVIQSNSGLAASLGEPRAGVVIGLDASFSMNHKDGELSRFDRAVKRVESLATEMQPGDPVTLVALGAEHRVVLHNMAFDENRFLDALESLKPVPETLDLDSVTRHLKRLAVEMEAPQKEIYFVSDMQAHDWKEGGKRLTEAFKDLSQTASTIFVPVEGTSANLAVTDLELVSGVLRKGTVARYRATVRNCGEQTVANVLVKAMVNSINADTKTIPSIAPGTAETVSLFIPFHNAGPAQITAELEPDALLTDNARRTVAVIRDSVSVLCVEGSPEDSAGFNGFASAALQAREVDAADEEYKVTSVPWIALPAQNLKDYDVVILADVPAITAQQARQLESYVRAGNGLIWFAGDNVKPAVWNKRSDLEGTPLLPAVINQNAIESDATVTGRPLDPTLPDHLVCSPLLSLSEDLLSEARFLKTLPVTPAANSVTVLSLAGQSTPLLIEHSVGRGQVFMFTTSAEPTWNNMALTPVFPMLLQQMVTYLTAREFEQPRLVGQSLSLAYVDQPDASDAVFDTPSGETITVPVMEQRGQYVALLEHALEDGFYLARVSVQAQGQPIAVNADTTESVVKQIKTEDLRKLFDESAIMIASSDDELAAHMDTARSGMSLWRSFLIAALALFLIESLLADRMHAKILRKGGPAPQAPVETAEAA